MFLVQYMKRFILKSVGVISIPILYLGINMIVNYFYYHNQEIPLKKASILIAGDSHPEKSLNPRFFSNAQNISQPAEPYVLTYWKLKTIFKSQVPDTLILGFAPHNISQFNDLKFSHNRWSAEMFQRSYTIGEFDRIDSLIPVDYDTYNQVLWKSTGLYPKKNHFKNFIGKYSNNNTSDVTDWEVVIDRHYFDEGKQLGVSTLSTRYLDSIIELCHAKKVDVILVSNPVHKNYLKNIPSSIMLEYNNLMTQYSKDNLIFNETTTHYADSLYYNADHLNETGAKVFSRSLIEKLKAVN